MVQLKINTQIKEYPDDITWQVIADEYQSGYSDEILLVQVNGKLQELQEKIREGEVQFITAEQSGNFRISAKCHPSDAEGILRSGRS